MPIDIRNIVKTNFNIETLIPSIGSYKKVLYVTNSKSWVGGTITSETTITDSTITVNESTFKTGVSNTAGRYVFTCTTASSTTSSRRWSLGTTTDITNTNLSSIYGITYTGTPAEGNTITVIYGTEVFSELSDAQNIFEQLGCNKNDLTLLYITEGTFADNVLAAKKAVSGTADDFIFVVIDPNYLTANPVDICGFASPYKVIPCVTKAMDSDLSAWADKPIAVKLGSNTVPLATAIAAYYSKVNLNNLLEVQDYCYTDESAVFTTDVDDGTKYLVVDATQTQYDTYVDIANFTDIVGNSIVNFGGNLTNGVSITAYFGTIASDNDIMFAVLRTMLNKQYLTAEGLNNVVAAINGALERYTRNGYLEQNSRYGGTTYIENYNGTSNVMIKENALLPSGYYVAAVPISRISVADRKAHKFTPIRVFMQTQAGARVVEIDGTIIE